MFSLLANANPLGHVVDHVLVRTGGGLWLVSNHVIMLLLAALIMLLIFPAVTRRYRNGHVPTGSQNFFEAILLFIRNDIAKPMLGDDTDRFIPFLWTQFFFVLILNLLGLLPLDAIQNLIFGTINLHFEPIFGTATSNFYVTGTLALIVFVVVQFNGIAAQGFEGWLHHFLGGAPWWLFWVMIPVEILGMLIKPFALAIRLAANMTAGHILLAVLAGFVPMAWDKMGAGGGLGIGVVSVVASIAIMLLELFVALLQAYLFTFLTTLFISQLITHHHDDDGHHHEEEGNEWSTSHAVREKYALTHDTAHKPLGA